MGQGLGGVRCAACMCVCVRRVCKCVPWRVRLRVRAFAWKGLCGSSDRVVVVGGVGGRAPGRLKTVF